MISVVANCAFEMKFLRTGSGRRSLLLYAEKKEARKNNNIVTGRL